MREVQERTDAGEFAEWLAFQQIDPSDELRADLRAAIIACTIANIFRTARSPVAKLEDFLPFLKQQIAPKKRDPKEMEAKLMAWVNQVKRKRKGGTRPS